MLHSVAVLAVAYEQLLNGHCGLLVEQSCLLSVHWTKIRKDGRERESEREEVIIRIVHTTTYNLPAVYTQNEIKFFLVYYVGCPLNVDKLNQLLEILQSTEILQIKLPFFGSVL